MAEVKKVVIEAGGKEFDLTLEEAKTLRDILNSTFPEPKTNYVPYQPVIIERYRQPWGPWVTWSSASGNTLYCSTSGTK